MKTLKDYLTESKKVYDFRIKIAGELSAEKEAIMKQCLERFSVASFKKSGTSPIQSLPLDFPKIRNQQVSVFEVALDYPTTPQELHEYISSSIALGPDYLVVRKPNEPTEYYQQPGEAREGALLQDSNYTEVPKIDTKDYYGTEYNISFVKALNDELKANRKERGEVIPNSTADDIIKNPGQTSNDIAPTNQSPIQQSDYDPRK